VLPEKRVRFAFIRSKQFTLNLIMHDIMISFSIGHICDGWCVDPVDTTWTSTDFSSAAACGSLCTPYDPTLLRKHIGDNIVAMSKAHTVTEKVSFEVRSVR
jgi:hypothetical protein